MERLQKVMAHAGVASRRKSEQLIKEGKVRVNGQLVLELGTKVNPLMDRIEVNGKVIQNEAKKTFLFYKPKSVITSVHDPQGRKVVTDYFSQIPERIYPVGRLDYDTEGALLLTNDGKLAHWFMHPKYEVDKEYIVTVKGKVTADQAEQLRKGIRLEDGLTAPASVTILSSQKNQSRLKIVIHEGRNRQIRRMCEAIGHSVKKLVRTRIAFLTLQGLNKGEFRPLTTSEYKRLVRLLQS